MNEIRLGLLGLGTVGASVCRLIKDNQDDLERRLGKTLRVSRACVRDLKKARDCEMSDIQVSQNPMDVILADDVDIVIELMGGIDQAQHAIQKALAHQKPVVTANKALIAEFGNDLFSLAKAQQTPILYEAAVAGGIPIIKTMREGLSGNPIEWFAGIINGTSNYILTQMQEQGLEFEYALKEAQDKGYAEEDPRLDIHGMDAAHKLSILASLAFGFPIQYDQVYCEGIQHITQFDVKKAKQMGYVIKHLGLATRSELKMGFHLQVHPVLLPKDHVLASVQGVMNAVYMMTFAAGPTLYYGAGAGGSATASAVLADVCDLVRQRQLPFEAQMPMLGYQQLTEQAIVDMSRFKTSYYLRIHAEDKLGTLANITQILAASRISIDSIHQEHQETIAGVVPIVIITNPTMERQMTQAISDMNALSVISQPVQRIRLVTLEDT